MTFDGERFVEACRAATGESGGGQAEVLELVQRAVGDPAAVMKSLGEPSRAGVQRMFVSDELTVLNLVWGPEMTLMPHNHAMWAAIGIYTGREDNIFWRREEDDPNGRVTARGARALSTGEVVPLGADVIHSVTNPIPRLTGALHVYGGNFFEAHRSEWDPETLLESRYEVQKHMDLFERSNRRSLEA